MKGLRIRQVLREVTVGETIEVSGWVRTRRDSKAGLSFIALNDGSCFNNLQVIAKNSLENYDTDIKKVRNGASISVRGELVESPAKGQRVELVASSITLLGEVHDGYPMQKKRINLDTLRTLAHVRPRTNTIGAVTRVRHHMAMAVHDFFRGNDFFYIHTPIITASDAEGAGEMFQVTTLDVGDAPRTDDGGIDWSQDFFGRQAFMTVSGQLQAEIYACSMGRVYTFGPTFRAENSNTARHASEFWMIEPECAFLELEGNADLAEAFIKHCVNHALTECEEDLAFFDKRIEKGLIDALVAIKDTPFTRITYTDAIALLNKSGQSFKHPTTWGKMLQTEHEKYLTDVVFKGPVIVHDYPAEKAFYMKLNDDEKTVRAMDVLVPRIGEIIGGSEREARLDVLLERIQHHGLDPKDYWWYVDLRRFGTVPHSGFGLGFERLLMMVTGMKNIRDVIPLPRTPRNAEF
ncbi:MAG: asparagine--tRNA ligase [Myxococcota bacterium]|nr:asparagine--tRNA ligase [Myxococcota bacterium]